MSANAARYFGMRPERCLLEDEHLTLWPLDVVVSREIARYRGDQVPLIANHDHDRALPRRSGDADWQSCTEWS